jgi:hypothetical protein
MVENKVPEVRYLTHMIVFPDDDAFIEQLPFVHDLQFESNNWMHTVFHHQDDARSLIKDLVTRGECRCKTPYPPGGISAKVDHVYKIENEPRQCGWFGSKQGV